MKNCIVFLDINFEYVLSDIAQYSKQELNIVRVFIIGISDKTHAAGFELHKMNTILDSGDVDIAILLTIDQDPVIRLINVAFPSPKNIELITWDQVSDTFFDAEGKMLLLKHRIEHEFPRSSNPYITVGDYSYFSSPTILGERWDDNSQLIIGKFCAIGPQNKIMVCEEHHKEWNTIYPLQEFLDFNHGSTTFAKGNVVIGNDVWTGIGVTILSGVTIGDGCIIGAGAVVSRSVEPYSIVVGNPSKVVKKRFSEDKIEKLLEMKWWNWKDADIYNARNLIQSSDIDGLYEFYKNIN